MNVTEKLKAWGLAHAQARNAEGAAQQGARPEDSAALRRKAKTLRDRADQLHREIYQSLDRKRGEGGEPPR